MHTCTHAHTQVKAAMKKCTSEAVRVATEQERRHAHAAHLRRRAAQSKEATDATAHLEALQAKWAEVQAYICISASPQSYLNPKSQPYLNPES